MYNPYDFSVGFTLIVEKNVSVANLAKLEAGSKAPAHGSKFFEEANITYPSLNGAIESGLSFLRRMHMFNVGVQ